MDFRGAVGIVGLVAGATALAWLSLDNERAWQALEDLADGIYWVYWHLRRLFISMAIGMLLIIRAILILIYRGRK